MIQHQQPIRFKTKYRMLGLTHPNSKPRHKPQTIPSPSCWSSILQWPWSQKYPTRWRSLLPKSHPHYFSAQQQISTFNPYGIPAMELCQHFLEELWHVPPPFMMTPQTIPSPSCWSSILKWPWSQRYPTRWRSLLPKSNPQEVKLYTRDLVVHIWITVS